MKKICGIILSAVSMIAVCGSFFACVTGDDITDKWTFGQVSMGGGGFVTGVFSTSEENLYYARTDAGGAYRWDESSGKWVSISYYISDADKGLLGIDGLAVDPNSPNKIYLLAGTGYFSDGKTAILCSQDYGNTFEHIEVTDMITAHGNGDGRQNGERIAVDPADGDIIYAGGRTGGIIKSTNGGKSWSVLENFPVKNTANGNGVNGIVITQSGKIYASVSRKNDKNVFVSDDLGFSWESVEGLPDEWMPQRLKLDADDNLYITYGNTEGPSSEGGGGIFRIGSDGMIDDISPANKTFGDIVTDPRNTLRLVACTESVWSMQPNGAYGDEFYVSDDGGGLWHRIENMTLNNGGVEWISQNSIHWCGSMMIDSYAPDTVMVTSGNGIFRCDNIWDSEPEFTFFVRGLEETVPLDCVSIKGGGLFTAIADYDGFENSDITDYGKMHSERISTTTSIAVAALNSSIRVKVGDDRSEQKILYTEDGGENWNYIRNPPNEKFVSHSGHAALTADGKNIIWSTSGFEGAFYTEDRGASWEKVTGIGSGCYLAADTVNSDYVYASGSEGFFVSNDGGKSFNGTSLFFGISGRIAPVNGIEGAVYIPASSGGLYFTEDNGESFTRLESVYRCDSVGTGKGRSDTYALYMWGQPSANDALGIYFSEDRGLTWTQINDERHQFGGCNGFIVGDENVFGRCYIGTVGLGVVYCDMNGIE